MMPIFTPGHFCHPLRAIIKYSVGYPGNCGFGLEIPLQIGQIVHFDQKNNHCEQREQKSFNPFEVQHVN